MEISINNKIDEVLLEKYEERNNMIEGMNRKISAFLEKYGIDLMVSAYLIYSIMINRAQDIYSYINGCYVIDYSYGFGSRLVIGSLMHLLFGEVVGAKQAYGFVVFCLVLLSVLFAMFVGTVYRKVNDKKGKIAIVFLTVFYLMSPASPEYLWTWENFGRLDTYLYILTLIIMFVTLKVNNQYVKYGLYLMLGILAIAIHQIYIFLFFPTLFVIMVHDIWEEKFSKKQIVLSVGVMAILCCTFLYMQLFSGIYYNDLNTLMAQLNQHADFYVDKGTMETEYFWEFKDHIIKNMLPELPHHLKYGFILFSMLIPIWGLYLWIWHKTIKLTENKLKKWKYRIMLASVLAYVPVFSFMNDWGRWFAALFSMSLINVLILAGKGDKKILGVLDCLGQSICKYLPVFGLFIIYISTFEKFEALNFPEQAQLFYYQVYDIKMWFLSLF